jgi:hypothetical protein
MSFNYTTLNEVKTWLAGLDVSEMPSTLDALIEQTWIPWAKRQVDTYIGENLDYTTIKEYYDGNGRADIVLNHRPIRFVRQCVLRIIPAMQWFEFKRWFHINYIDQLGVKIAEPGGVEPIGSGTPIYTFAAGSPVPDDLISATPTGTFSSATSQYEKSDLFVDCKLGLLTIPPRIMYLENQAIPFWNYTWLRGFSNIEITYDYGYKSLDELPVEIRSACAQFVAAAVLKNKGLFMGGGASSFSLGTAPRAFGSTPYAGHIQSYLESARMALNPYKRIRA